MSELEHHDFPINIEDIMHTAYLQYSLSVNVGRAIPDVRDGLKPVNRRILYAMKKLGLTKSHSYTKSAKVVGEVIGNYHPHGDSSVYDAMVRLAQPFSLRMTMVDGHGNFGSIDGDPAAAYRYTECRLERLAEEMLVDLEKDTVDMMPTFDESGVEPSVLPARFPQLLINGTTGIGVGMATSIPTHNLGEVINATVALLDNPQASIEELMRHLPGPDFPTGAIIRGISSIRQFYTTGRGSIKMRAKAEIIEENNREQIVISEIPYAVNKATLVESIANLVLEKKVQGITGIRDESSMKVGVRIVIDVKRGVMASVILNQLFAHTQLETTFPCTMLVVDHNRPRVMNLAQVLQAYLDHRMEVLIRKTKFDLNKAQARAHIVEGFLKALDLIDEVVNTIRESKTKAEAGEALQSKFGFSELQAAAILEMRLHQLTGLAREELDAEFAELCANIKYYNELLASREMRLGVIRADLLEVRDKYADPRRTEITTADGDLNIADLIERHSCVITVSNTGYIKRVPAATYQTQHRGGKGIIAMKTKDEDYVEHLFNADSHDLIFFFTDRGFMYWLNVYEIPEASRSSNGRAIVNMLPKLETGEKIRAMLTVKPEELNEAGKFMLMCTRRGFIKKMPLELFKNLRRVGLRALVIEEDDDLISAAICENGNEVLLSTAKGMACRFTLSDEELRPMGRTARGVTGMRFKIEGDYLVAMTVIREQLDDEEALDEDAEVLEVESGSDDAEIIENAAGPQVLVVSDGGMGKRSLASTYRKTRRGAKGVVSIKLRENELVVNTIQIQDGDELLITTERGQLTRIPLDEIRTVGRASKGVKIMNLNEGDRITGAVSLIEVKGEEKADENASDGEVTAPDAPETSTEQAQVTDNSAEMTDDSAPDTEA
ncbi:MAG: DNA gyrase subunit A [Lentisphaerae bacterium]|nr:DNA gyrase subunit A [Lentisphaerota bacterium]